MRLVLLAFLSLFTLPVLAQTNDDSAKVRRLSLEDCIEMALKHNLDLQIDRYSPEFQLYSLRADYAPYDPLLSLAGDHSFAKTPSQSLSAGVAAPGSESTQNEFSAGINGATPWGMTYSLGTGRIFDQNGFNSSANDALPGTFTNSPFETAGASPLAKVTQPLLKNFWIDQTRFTILVGKNRLKYSEQTLRLQIMQTITTLEQAYYDLIYDRENVVVQQKAVELAEKLVAENRKRLEVGALAPLDLQSAEAQAASSRAAVIAAKSQLGTQERLVKQLITDRFSAWADLELEPTGNLEAFRPIVNLQSSWRLGLEQRPELAQAKLDVEKSGIQLKYDRNQLFPELDLIGTAGYSAFGNVRPPNSFGFSDAFSQIANRDNPNWSVGGLLSFPLANIGPRNTYKADKATMAQMLLTLKKLEQQVMIDIDNDIGTIRANYDQVQATKAARQYQEAALDAEQKKLENGKSTTYTVLQVQRDLTVARGNEIQALDNYNKSLSQLSLHEGSTLDRLHVKLEWKKQ